MTFVIAAIYKFFPVKQPQQLVEQLKLLLQQNHILGTLIVAQEGLNGTVCGARAAIDSLIEFLSQQGIFQGCEYKEAEYHQQVFKKCKVKLKPEIVTLKMPVDPTSMVGQYVKPEDWNALISEPETIVVDTRNNYEYKIGTFAGAINPKTEKFSELHEFVESQLAQNKDAKIAMYCTGGVRCEKSTSLLLQQGFKQVYHLKGGILNYLAQVPATETLWQGECYVFDKRVSVGTGLVKGDSKLCYGCGDVLLPTQSPSDCLQCRKPAQVNG